MADVEGGVGVETCARASNSGRGRFWSDSRVPAVCPFARTDVTMMALPPVDGFPEFPDTFKDFFSKLDENDETVSSLLEDKLIPRGDKLKQRQQERRWVITRRSFHRKPVEYINKPDPPDLSPSPTHARRRSSSIAVARQPPDLHRFLQAEQSRPWGHLSPAACSPTPSPAGSRPVSPRPRPVGTAYRCRTASMPAVPARHKLHFTFPLVQRLKSDSHGLDFWNLEFSKSEEIHKSWRRTEHLMRQ
ncbi:hypothetical protein J6590_019455 [Homalodisca vitripennis]|nr:hypothetical protein J6590_019455 [Homalodisca vitripennis]